MRKAIRLFLLILGLFLLTNPSLAEYIYYHRISPEPPVPIYERAKDFANSSWADDTNSSGTMEFIWLNPTNDKTCVYTSNYIGEESDYYSECRVDSIGMWKIKYLETDGDGGRIGGGGNSHVEFGVECAPEFSSYAFVIISLFSTYFILRKKIV